MTKIECLWQKGYEYEIADSWIVEDEQVEKELDYYLENKFQVGEVVEGWEFKGFFIDNVFWKGETYDYHITDYEEAKLEDRYELYREARI